MNWKLPRLNRPVPSNSLALRILEMGYEGSGVVPIDSFGRTLRLNKLITKVNNNLEIPVRFLLNDKF